LRHHASSAVKRLVDALCRGWSSQSDTIKIKSR
jgi:hypothetical protein